MVLWAIFCVPLLHNLAVAEPITLKQILESVKKHHPLLFAALEERNTAEADLLSARGAFDPTIKINGYNRAVGYYEGNRFGAFLDQPVESTGGRVFGGYRRSDGRIPVYEGDELTLSDGEFSIGAEQALLRDGVIDRRRANISRFEIQQNIAEFNIHERMIALTRAATLSYWDWVVAGRRVEVLKRLLSTAEIRNGQIEQRVKHGDLPAFDLDDSRRQVFQRQAQLIQAERALQNSSFELSLFYRNLAGSPVVPENSELPKNYNDQLALKLDSNDSLLEIALVRRPEIQRLNGQLNQNQIESNLAENQILPKIDLQIIAAQDSGSGSNTLEEGEIKAGIKVELPLRTRTAEGRVQAAAAKARELDRLLKFQKDRIAVEIRDSINALELVHRRYLLAEKEIQAAIKLEEGERVRFNLGDSNLIFVNLREQASAEASIREIEAFQDYQRAKAALRAALAYSIDDLLKDLN
jgi:outer membrane protein TolC